MNARRVYGISAGLTAAGAAGAWALGGVEAALGFTAGAAYSVLNLRALHGVVEALGTERRPVVAGTFMALRLLLLGGMLYVIVSTLGSGLSAALAGLFVALLAVVLDSVYQLIYGTAP